MVFGCQGVFKHHWGPAESYFQQDVAPYCWAEIVAQLFKEHDSDFKVLHSPVQRNKQTLVGHNWTFGTEILLQTFGSAVCRCYHFSLAEHTRRTTAAPTVVVVLSVNLCC